MKHRRSRPLVAEINITPFTDVILVLLVIFMIATPLLSQSAFDVNLPKAGTARPLALKTDVTITIAREGAVYLEGKSLPHAALKSKMQQVRDNSAKISVTLVIDEGSQFRNVVAVIDTLRELGIDDFSVAARKE